MTLQMARQAALLLLFTLVVGTAAAQQASAPNPAADEKTAIKSVQESPGTPAAAPDFKNWNEKLSYALGVDLGKSLRWQRIGVDADALVQALRDTLAGNQLRMTDADVTATLKRFQEEQKQDLEHAKAMRSEKNKREAEAFVAENVKKPGVVILPSGLQYKILKTGDGQKPTVSDKVVCHYRGTLLDGTEFDSSYKRNQPATLPVKGLIKGWSEALQLMPVGSKWQLFIPPQLAYADRVVGGVGPNAMLIFEVELVSIESPAQANTQQVPTAKKDTDIAAQAKP